MASIPTRYKYLTGPVMVALPCAVCKVDRQWERWYDATWGLTMRRCQGCGLEEVDKPVR